jgi:cytochrome P450
VTQRLGAISDLDLFADDVLHDPYDPYARLREAGAAVWMSRLGMWALPRYAQVRAALLDWKTFSSQDAVCVGEEHNALYSGTVLASDPPLHDRLRAVIAPSLTPRALAAMKAEIESQADTLVEVLVARGSFDAVADLAAVFPVSVVCDLVGLPMDERDRLLARADASFNTFGPANARAAASMWAFPESFNYIQKVATRERLRPGSFGASVYEAADRGEITAEQCLPVMLAYLFAGMDTTVNAISSAVWLLTQYPDQWDAMRANPALVGRAFEETLRFESPVQMFGRKLMKDYDAEGVTLEPGERALLLYASANRDERKFPHADRFDVMRDSNAHLSFGMGLHLCAGQGLARLEGHAVLAALARRARRVELIEAKRHLNNAVRGLKEAHVRVN